MEFLFFAIALVITFCGGVYLSKWIIGDAIAIKDHISAELGASESRIKAELADIRSKIASNFR